MPRLNATDRKATLLKKQEQIAEQLKQLKAREQEANRKADTRRKVIAGALALEHLNQHPDTEFGQVMLKLLHDYVDERSRYLFGFLPNRGDASSAPTPPAAPGHPAAATIAAAARATTTPT